MKLQNYLMGRNRRKMTKKFVIIISSQRCGSTLFCQDLQSIGIGKPNEHALPLMRSGKPFTLEQLYEKCKAPESAEQVFALKSMVSYTSELVKIRFPDVYDAERSRVVDDYVAELEIFIEILKSDFDIVVPFIITRNNVVDVAISRTLAKLTKVYHSKKEIDNLYNDIGIEIAVQNILSALVVARRENKILHNFASRLGDSALSFDYEDLSSKESELFIKVKAHLAKYGMQPNAESFTRNKNIKLIPPEISSKFKKILTAEFSHFASLCVADLQDGRASR